MRKIYLSFFIFILCFGITNSQEIVDASKESIDIIEVKPINKLNWETTYDSALKRAKKENKPLLIYFTGSDWCGPCKRLKKSLFNTEKFQDYADHKLVLYKADFPRNKNLVDANTKQVNKELSTRFGQTKFPTMILVDAKEQELGIKEGMYMTEYYYPFFDKAIRGF